MPYIGNTIRAADDYRLIDDISSGFNGSTTSFALQVAGSAPVPFPKSPQQVLISVNGVIQEPDPTGASGFNLVGTNIVFSSAPTNGHAFFGIIYATADYLNAGGNFPSGSLGAPSITFIGDENSGLYRKSGGSVGFVSDATEIANFDSNGITISSGNIIIPDSIIHNGDTNTKIRFPSADTITAETGGSERVRVDSSGNVGIATTSGGGKLAILSNSSTYEGLELQTPSGDGSGEFHIGVHQSGTTSGRTIVFKRGGADGMDTESMRIDASGNVGIGTNSPSALLDVELGSTGTIAQFRGADTDILNIDGDSNRITLDARNVGALAFEMQGSEVMRIDSSGRLLIGTSSSLGVLGLAAQIQVAGDTAGESSLALRRFGNSAQGPFLTFSNSRNAADGSRTIVQNGDELGRLTFCGDDGVDLATGAAEVRGNVDGTPGANDMPGRLTFHTTADGASSLTERMRITSAGNVGIGTTSPRTELDLSDGQLSFSHRTDYSIRFYNGNGNNWSSINNPQAADGNATNHSELEFRTAVGIAMHMATDGDIGIGTTSPAQHLHIEKNVNGDERVQISNPNTGSSARAALKCQSDSSTLDIMATSAAYSGVSSWGDSAVLTTGSGTSGGLIFNSQASNSAIKFQTQTNERMRIASDGKVVIGGNAKAKKLTIVDDNASQAGANDGTITDALVMLYGGKRTVVNSDLTLDETIIHLKGQITDSGTSSTGEHTTNKIVFSGRRATGAQCWIEHTTDWNYSTQNAGGNLIFKTSPLSSNGSTAPIQRMVIHNDGAIVVNDTGDVGGGEGGVRLKNPDVGTCRFGASNAGQITYIQFINGSSIAGSISGSSSSTSFNTTSDYRLKENESLISDGIARLKQLKPYRFNWKSDSSTIVDGFFAHEVSSIVPESITGTKDAVAVEDDVEKGLADAVGDPIYQSIDQAKLVPLLTAALQEEIAKREALETRIAALEAA